MSVLKTLAGLVFDEAVDRKQRGQLLTLGSGVALLAGRKAMSLALFSQGAKDIEAEWRAAHPDFVGGRRERWKAAIEFYEQTHQNPTNRKLHVIGIPIIVGATTGLLVWPSYSPPWFLSAGGFAFGWALNLLGHAVYEKNAPAFAEDPLSFVAGPVWDLMNLKKVLRGETGSEDNVVPLHVVPG